MIVRGKETAVDENAHKNISVPISHCLIEKVPPQCTVQVSLLLLAIVIVFNIVKIGWLLATVISRNFGPLGTVGDAIASFLSP